MTQSSGNDSLMGDGAKGISFKDMPIGTTYRGTVISEPEKIQASDWITKLPATWPDGNPKYLIAFKIQDPSLRNPADPTDEGIRGVYLPIPSDARTKAAAAVLAAGAKGIHVGGVYSQTLSGTQPSAKGNDQKLYTVTYVPPPASGNVALVPPADPYSTPAVQAPTAAPINPPPPGVTAEQWAAMDAEQRSKVLAIQSALPPF